MLILSRIFYNAKKMRFIYVRNSSEKWRKCLGCLHIHYIDFESKLSGHTNIRYYILKLIVRLSSDIIGKRTNRI